MNKPLGELIRRLPRTTQKKLQARAKQLIAAERTLQELREAQQRSQASLAKQLRVKQAAVSRLERRTDMYVSSLRAYIEAMGGKLEIVASFPDSKPVRITQFEKIG
jgi:ribosome-binding protein aMBF1 (putative translation factor)